MATFADTDTKIAKFGRWVDDGTRLDGWGSGAAQYFRVTGTGLSLNESSAAGAGVEASVDGGAFAALTTSGLGLTVNGVTVVFVALADTTHDVILRENAAYASGLFSIRKVDGLIVVGGAPALAAHPDCDSSGSQTYLYTSAFLQHNYAEVPATVLGYSVASAPPGWPITGGGQTSGSGITAENAMMIFRTDAEQILAMFRGTAHYRMYVDGCEYAVGTFTVTSGAYSLPSTGPLKLTLPNDGLSHEVMLVGSSVFDLINAKGGTGILASKYQSALKVVGLGHSRVEGNAATNYADGSSNWDIESTIALQNVGQPIRYYSRGVSGSRIAGGAFNWDDSPTITDQLTAVDADIILIDLIDNDAAGLTTQGAEDALVVHGISMLNLILAAAPDAVIGWTEPPTNATTNRTRQLAVVNRSVAGCSDTSRVFVLPCHASWAHSTNASAGVHPYPAGNSELAGYYQGAVHITANPSGGDTFTITRRNTQADIFTFDAGAHGASPNPVTIGATVADTLTNLYTKLIAILGRRYVTSKVSLATGSPVAQYTVELRQIDSLAKSGANLAVYKLANTVPGYTTKMLDLIQRWQVINNEQIDSWSVAAIQTIGPNGWTDPDGFVGSRAAGAGGTITLNNGDTSNPLECPFDQVYTTPTGYHIVGHEVRLYYAVTSGTETGVTVEVTTDNGGSGSTPLSSTASDSLGDYIRFGGPTTATGNASDIANLVGTDGLFQITIVNNSGGAVTVGFWARRIIYLEADPVSSGDGWSGGTWRDREFRSRSFLR